MILKNLFKKNSLKRFIFEKKNQFKTNKCRIFFSLCYPRGAHRFPQKNVGQFGLAVWPAIANIYELYYINSIGSNE